MKVQQSTTSENQGYEESSNGDKRLTFCVAFLSVLCVSLAFVVGYMAYDATEEHTCSHDLSKLDGVYITNPYVDMAFTFYYRDQDLYCKRIHLVLAEVLDGHCEIVRGLVVHHVPHHSAESGQRKLLLNLLGIILSKLILCKHLR